MSLFGNVQKPVPDYIFDSEIAMNATGRYNSFDIGKFCWRTDEDKIYFLKSLIDPDTPNATPTWIGVSGGGGCELIESIPVTINGQTILFDDIPQRFRHLELRYSGRTDLSNFADQLSLVVNSNTTDAFYTSVYTTFDGTTVSPAIGFVSRIFGEIPGNSATFPNVGQGILRMNNYSGQGTKIVEFDVCSPSNIAANDETFTVCKGFFIYQDSQPITSLELRASGGNYFLPDVSRFDLYGY